MFNASTKGEWYGVLPTKSGDVVVIFDGALPKAATGKVYFYNTQKDKILEYVENIVKPKLIDLKGDALREAQDNYELPWEEAKRAFLVSKGITVDPVILEDGDDTEIKYMLLDLDEDTIVVEDEFEDL